MNKDMIKQMEQWENIKSIFKVAKKLNISISSDEFDDHYPLKYISLTSVEERYNK